MSNLTLGCHFVGSGSARFPRIFSRQAENCETNFTTARTLTLGSSVRPHGPET